MLKESFTDFEKQTISRQIKNISLETIEREMVQLAEIGKNAHTASPRCRIGNNVVDYFTFQQQQQHQQQTYNNYDQSSASTTATIMHKMMMRRNDNIYNCDDLLLLLVVVVVVVREENVIQ